MHEIKNIIFFFFPASNKNVKCVKVAHVVHSEKLTYLFPLIMICHHALPRLNFFRTINILLNKYFSNEFRSGKEWWHGTFL